MVETTDDNPEPQPLSVLTLPSHMPETDQPAVQPPNSSPPPYEQAMTTGTTVYVSSIFPNFDPPPKYPCAHDPTRVCHFCTTSPFCQTSSPARSRAHSWHNRSNWLRVAFLLFSFLFIFLLYSVLYNIIVLEPLIYADPDDLPDGEPTPKAQI